MKMVTALVASARKKHTYEAVCRFLDHLHGLGDVEHEIVVLSDYRLENCRGCKRCFEQGEEFCPLKDDRDVLIEKLAASDAVVFASPNYSFQVSAVMKTFLDRLGFVFHRPRFFGKTCTSIVTQGVYGGSRIVNYLDLVGSGLGFNTVKGSCLTALEPMTDREKQKIDRTLAAHSRRFHRRLTQPAYPAPTWFQLMAFRFARTSIRLELDERNLDYRYYQDRGWFTSDYYYPVRLGMLKRVAGGLLDMIQARMTRSRKS